MGTREQGGRVKAKPSVTQTKIFRKILDRDVQLPVIIFKGPGQIHKTVQVK